MYVDWQHVFQFVGGLGFFLFSLKYMSQGLQNWAGEQLRLLLHRFTTHPAIGVLIGMALAMVLQSSTATIIITLGLVSANFMTLRQSIGLILGANIGTTLTSFLLGFHIGSVAFPIIACGAFLIYFAKKQWPQHMGQFLFGLGGMYIGLNWMTTMIKPVIDSEVFLRWSTHLSEIPVTGVLLGIITTAIVQSSSATVGLLQGLYEAGGLRLDAALPILYGENIGTTLTVLFASLSMTLVAKRAAMAHVFINVIGTIIFFIGMHPFIIYLQWLETTTTMTPRMTIAFAHGTFNVVTTIALLPFIGVLIWLVEKCVPGANAQATYAPSHLEHHLIKASPVLAIGQAKEEAVHMAHLCVQGFQAMTTYIHTGDTHQRTAALHIEDMINHADQTITHYLVAISTHQLSKGESERHHTLLEVVRDLERIGDHIENMIELYDDLTRQRHAFSDFAKIELNDMFDVTGEALQKAIAVFDDVDLSLISHIMLLEERIDEMERANRKKHIYRLNHGECSAHAGIIFSEMMSNLERIGDHCVNIAEAMIVK
ncbi:Na/Pi cotransporter family protein [Kurthia massiliensis]|uniref:Na/Pi cotransporter family protein n=1 Tax=Kurthia massiliensis TaxID=1033739 RepID=UPI000288C69D|nr:Na/Pi cotransporter family protein [Kurthia massiliensis]